MRTTELRCSLAWLWIVVSTPLAAAQTTIDGNDLALKSTGNLSGASDWTIDRNGYVGTYLQLDAPGSVTIGVNASGTIDNDILPHMNFVIADTKAGFDVASGFDNYEHTFDLPAGTYVVRTEFNNDVDASGRQITVRDLTVSGAEVLNSSTSSNALAAADTYIQNFRRGDVTIGLSGLAPGTTLDVRLKRHAFNFGTAVPGVSYSNVNNYLGSGGTTRQTQYQARLNQNFNAVVPENAGKWASNEDVRDEVVDPVPPAPPNGMDNVDLILDYAQAHNMRARMHNVLWGTQQPNWVTTMLNNPTAIDPASGLTNTQALRQEISERIDYYVGDGPGGFEDHSTRYSELDVYNESYHTGSNAVGDNNHWSRLGEATGIADIYREAKQAVADSGGLAKMFVNEYGVLGSGDYAGWYMGHIDEIRNAGLAAGYGDVVGGIGVQHYPGGSQNSGNIMRTLQNLSVQGLPIALTEFGVSNGVSESTAANILEQTVRLVFGTADATGFFMWGFHQESGTGATTLFAPAAALYTVNTSNFNSWTLTPAGEVWRDMLGIEDFDGDPDNGWTTQLDDLVVDANGTVSFNAFWGDYELVTGGQTYELALAKGTSLYSLVVAAGDYNGDGSVDGADYTVWRDTLGSTADLRADGNGNRVIDDGDYAVWKSLFGTTYGSGSGQTSNAVPEPASATLLLIVAAISACRRGNRTRRSRPVPSTSRRYRWHTCRSRHP